MYAYVKLKDIETVVTVEDLQLIKTEIVSTGNVTETNDFKSFTFFRKHTANYIFVGKTILHVPGSAIEYVTIC